MFYFFRGIRKPFIFGIWIVISCLSGGPRAIAAGDYREGYIITNLGDTLVGYVDYKDWEINPESVVFTLVLGPVGKTFYIDELQGFGVKKKIYRRNIVEIDKSPLRRRDLNHLEEPEFVSDTVFLQILVEGDKMLYYLGDENGKKHFFIGSDGQIHTLIYDRYLSDKKGEPPVAINSSYRDQLVAYLHDCSSIKDVVPLVEYNTEDLIDLFKYHSRCVESSIDYSLKMNKAELEWGLLLGGTYTQFDIRGDNYAFQDLVDEVYSQSTDITFGFNCNILFPMKGRSLLSFNNEFIYNTYYVNSYSRSPETGDQYGSLYTEFGFSYINWNMILRYYYYPIGDFNVYTNIGYSFGYAVQVTNYERKESHFNTTRIREGEAIKDPNDYEFGYLVGLGADYGRFSLEMRFERRDGMIPYFGVGAKTTRYYALLGYKLGKIKRKKF